jgi:hypothetical protein
MTLGILFPFSFIIAGLFGIDDLYGFLALIAVLEAFYAAIFFPALKKRIIEAEL